MKKLIVILVFCLIAVSVSADEYFYCGYTNKDGTGQDYAKWGKGTDFKYNKSTQRWEWISEYISNYIYPDGRYVGKGKAPGFADRVGRCDNEAEKIYKKNIEELKRLMGQ
jgi:hypothetical protein